VFLPEQYAASGATPRGALLARTAVTSSVIAAYLSYGAAGVVILDISTSATEALSRLDIGARSPA